MESIYQIPSKICTDAEQKNFWSKVIIDQKASRLSTKRFCDQHQINFSTFTYWKYKKNKSCSKLKNNISKAKNKQPDKEVAKFIPLQVAADIPSNEHHKDAAINVQDKKVEIAFKNGHRMILPLVISETNLLLLIKIVGGLQC